MARILFVVPSRHTNLHVALTTLRSAGHAVTVLAADPVGSGEIPGVRHRVLGRRPDPAEVAAAVREVDPDLTLIRRCWDLGRTALGPARSVESAIVAYDLKPATSRRPLAMRLKYALQRRPWHRVTPVRGLDHTAPCDPHATFLPWPTAASPDVVHRDMGQGPLRVLCMGKLAQGRKNQTLVIDAMRPLAEADGARLTLVGSSGGAAGADPAHLRMLRDAAVRHDWIDLKEDVPYADMGSYYASHHVCILPAFDEVLGFAPVEGMAYGTILLISVDAGSAGYIEDGVNGFRIDPTDMDGLHRTLAALSRAPDLRVRLSRSAMSTAAGDLSPETFLRRFESLLRHVPARGPRA